EDYDLCSKCYITIKHQHRMERSDDTNEIKTNSDTTINTQQQRQLTMQRILPFCASFNHKIQRQRAATMQAD
ncbi:unnamed protein product, partial [Rotaria sp. Silwood1]